MTDAWLALSFVKTFRAQLKGYSRCNRLSRPFDVVFDLPVIEVDRLMPTHINQVKTTAGSGRVELIEKAQSSIYAVAV